MPIPPKRARDRRGLLDLHRDPVVTAWQRLTSETGGDTCPHANPKSLTCFSPKL